MASKIVSFNLNGREVEVLVKPLITVQALLREDLDLVQRLIEQVDVARLIDQELDNDAEELCLILGITA